MCPNVWSFGKQQQIWGQQVVTCIEYADDVVIDMMQCLDLEITQARPISWRSPDGSLQNIEAVILPEFARNQPPELIPPLHEFSCQRHQVHLACANVNPTLNADGSTRWTAQDVKMVRLPVLTKEPRIRTGRERGGAKETTRQRGRKTERQRQRQRPL